MNRLLSAALAATVITIGTGLAKAQGGRFPTVDGWTQSADSAAYTPDNLWDFIDGAAELFLSYGFADLHVAEYTDATGTDVRVELYRHRSEQHAFGMYSQERSPQYHFLDIGTQGYCEEGVLNFYCGASYVKMSTHRAGKYGRDALEQIGRVVAAHLGGCGPSPPLLQAFPSDGKRANSESYVAENFLGYGILRSAYVADYVGGIRLFIIEGSSPEATRRTLDAYLRVTAAGNPSGENRIVQVSDPHNGPVRLSISGRYLCGIVGPATDDQSEKLLQELRTRIASLRR